MKKIKTTDHAGTLARDWGYGGGSRLVCFFWEQAGDELAMGDQRMRSVGLGNHWSFLAWVRAWRISTQITEAGANLGSSDAWATHALLLDTLGGDTWVCLMEEAQSAARSQALPVAQ